MSNLRYLVVEVFESLRAAAKEKPVIIGGAIALAAIILMRLLVAVCGFFFFQRGRGFSSRRGYGYFRRPAVVWGTGSF
jgi:hypothetical protein